MNNKRKNRSFILNNRKTRNITFISYRFWAISEMDSFNRSIMKSISFRILATLTTILTIYLFTGSFATAGKVGAIGVFTKLILYYFHERAWDNVTWGKEIEMVQPRVTHQPMDD